jgi:D-lyxose ketol-isomerase
MRRSEVNAIMRSANQFIRECNFYLPAFAYWTPEEWRRKGEEVREIVDHKLGWDITDFGSGDFRHTGLFLFTIRNGSPENLKTFQGKIYAEKILIVQVGQVTPYHYHWNKIEDIINRSGGRLMIELYNSLPDGELDRVSEVKVSLDGVLHALPAGGRVVLNPGESITLTQDLYHKFWGEQAPVLVGEVSAVNDDDLDNRFYNAPGRFPEIDEDEAPLYLLCNDYPNFYGGGSG